MFIYIYLSTLLFLLGVFGMFFSRKHIIIILLALELILLSIDINFCVFGVFLNDLLGQIYALMVLTIAAAESSIGLAILIIYYRLRGGISIDLISLLKS
jgi:NADH-quinone oxidoreductase subunit K